MSEHLIYHMCLREAWRAALGSGRYEGFGDDIRDGFLHFSTAGQVAESAARHRAGVDGLLLIGVDPASLGPALKWEPSRGGQLFPHLYGALDTALAVRVADLTLGDDGRHRFPADIPPYPALGQGA